MKLPKIVLLPHEFSTSTLLIVVTAYVRIWNYEGINKYSY